MGSSYIIIIKQNLTEYLLRLEGGLRPDIDKRFSFFCLLRSSALPAVGSLMGANGVVDVPDADDPPRPSSSTDSCTGCGKNKKQKPDETERNQTNVHASLHRKC